MKYLHFTENPPSTVEILDKLRSLRDATEVAALSMEDLMEVSVEPGNTLAFVGPIFGRSIGQLTQRISANLACPIIGLSFVPAPVVATHVHAIVSPDASVEFYLRAIKRAQKRHAAPAVVSSPVENVRHLEPVGQAVEHYPSFGRRHSA